LNIYQFVGVESPPDFNGKPLGEWTVEHRCITFGSGGFQIKFLDSMKYFVGSLAKNVEDRLKNVGNAEDAFPIMLKHHPDIAAKHLPNQKRGLLCSLVRKLEFAYEHMDGPERWQDAPVPPPDAFFNSLCRKPIEPEAYEELQRLAEATGATTFEHTLITYLANDILQQADLLLAFR
jgi:hypothetical protein